MATPGAVPGLLRRVELEFHPRSHAVWELEFWRAVDIPRGPFRSRGLTEESSPVRHIDLPLFWLCYPKCRGIFGIHGVLRGVPLIILSRRYWR